MRNILIELASGTINLALFVLMFIANVGAAAQ